MDWKDTVTSFINNIPQQKKERKSEKKKPLPDNIKVLDVAWPFPPSQVQYSLMEQLEQLRLVANKLGLYDAADYLKFDKK